MENTSEHSCIHIWSLLQPLNSATIVGKQAWRIHNEHSGTVIKLYLWTFTFEFSITFMAEEILYIFDFFFLFGYLKVAHGPNKDGPD